MAAWASANGVRPEIRTLIHYLPDALARLFRRIPNRSRRPRLGSVVPRIDLGRAGMLTRETRRALAFGRLSPEDAAAFAD